VQILFLGEVEIGIWNMESIWNMECEILKIQLPVICIVWSDSSCAAAGGCAVVQNMHMKYGWKRTWNMEYEILKIQLSFMCIVRSDDGALLSELLPVSSMEPIEVYP
jgi:hypothetical protein